MNAGGSSWLFIFFREKAVQNADIFEPQMNGRKGKLHGTYKKTV